MDPDDAKATAGLRILAQCAPSPSLHRIRGWMRRKGRLAGQRHPGGCFRLERNSLTAKNALCDHVLRLARWERQAFPTLRPEVREKADAPCVMPLAGGSSRLIAPLSTATVTSQAADAPLAPGGRDGRGADRPLPRPRVLDEDRDLRRRRRERAAAELPPSWRQSWRAHGAAGPGRACPAVPAATSAVWEFFVGALSVLQRASRFA